MLEELPHNCEYIVMQDGEQDSGSYDAHRQGSDWLDEDIQVPQYLDIFYKYARVPANRFHGLSLL